MSSEYEPLFSGDPSRAHAGGDETDLERVRQRFQSAIAPFLRSPVSWLAWSVVLPAAAKLHPWAWTRFGLQGVMLLWSGAILAGGLVEGATLWRVRRRVTPSPLVGWVLHAQGNASLVGLALSVFLVWLGFAAALPGLWLLLVGHSFYVLGGLAFAPFRLYGLVFQLGGAAALWPGTNALNVFAGVTGAANLWLAWKVWRVGHSG